MKTTDLLNEISGAGAGRTPAYYVDRYIQPKNQKGAPLPTEKLAANRAQLQLEPIRQIGSPRRASPQGFYVLPYVPQLEKSVPDESGAVNNNFINELSKIKSIPVETLGDGLIRYSESNLIAAAQAADSAIASFSQSQDYKVQTQDNTEVIVQRRLQPASTSRKFGTKNIHWVQSTSQLPKEKNSILPSGAIVLVHFVADSYKEISVGKRVSVADEQETNGLLRGVFDFWVGFIVPYINKNSSSIINAAVTKNNKPFTDSFNLGMLSKLSSDIGKFVGQGVKTTAPLSRVGPADVLGLDTPAAGFDTPAFATVRDPLATKGNAGHPFSGKRFTPPAGAKVKTELEQVLSSANPERRSKILELYDKIVGNGGPISFPVVVDNLRAAGMTANAVYKNFMELAHPLMLIDGNVRDNGVGAAVKKYLNFNLDQGTVVYPALKNNPLWDSAIVGPDGQWLLLSSKAAPHQSIGGAQPTDAKVFLKLFDKTLESFMSGRQAKDYGQEIVFMLWLKGKLGGGRDSLNNPYIKKAKEFQQRINPKKYKSMQENDDDNEGDDDQEPVEISSKAQRIIDDTLGWINSQPKMQKFLTYIVNNGPLVQIDTQGSFNNPSSTGASQDKFILNSVIATWPNKLADSVTIESIMGTDKLGFKLNRGGGLGAISRGIQSQVKAKGVDPSSPEGQALTAKKYDTLKRYQQRRFGRDKTFVGTDAIKNIPIAMPIGENEATVEVPWLVFLNWFKEYLDKSFQKIEKSLDKAIKVEDLVKLVRPWQDRNGHDYEFENLLDQFNKLEIVDDSTINDTAFPPISQISARKQKQPREKREKVAKEKKLPKKTKNTAAGNAVRDNDYVKTVVLNEFPNLFNKGRHDLAKSIIGLITSAPADTFDAYKNKLAQLLKDDAKLLEILKNETNHRYDFSMNSESVSHIMEGLKNITYIRALTALYLGMKLKSDPSNDNLFKEFIEEITKVGSAGFRLTKDQQAGIQNSLITNKVKGIKK